MVIEKTCDIGEAKSSEGVPDVPDDTGSPVDWLENELSTGEGTPGAAPVDGENLTTPTTMELSDLVESTPASQVAAAFAAVPAVHGDPTPAEAITPTTLFMPPPPDRSPAPQLMPPPPDQSLARQLMPPPPDVNPARARSPEGGDFTIRRRCADGVVHSSLKGADTGKLTPSPVRRATASAGKRSPTPKKTASGQSRKAPLKVVVSPPKVFAIPAPRAASSPPGMC